MKPGNGGERRGQTRTADDKWSTALTCIEPNKILVRGYPLDEIMGRLREIVDAEGTAADLGGVRLERLYSNRYFFGQHHRRLDGGLQFMNDLRHVLFCRSEAVSHDFDGLFDRVRHGGDLLLGCHHAPLSW